MAIINGTSGSETVNGTTSDDTINGLGGNDALIGDLGDDFYDFSGVFGNDTVTELSAGGNDTLRILSDIPASAIRIVGDAFDDLYVVADGFGSIRLVDHLLGAKVEFLKIGSAAPISLTEGLKITGSINSEALYGTSFNDTFIGGGGNDSMRGRLGNDTYIIENAGASIIVENLNEGTDTVKSSISFSLPVNVENRHIDGYTGY